MRVFKLRNSDFSYLALLAFVPLLCAVQSAHAADEVATDSTVQLGRLMEIDVRAPLKGGPLIGTPISTSKGVMQESMQDSGFGNFLDRDGIKVSGWVTNGVNQTTSSRSNLPMGYSVFPNREDLNEVVLRIARDVDTVQKDHIDWGFHIDAMYGIDYYMFLSKGLWDYQLAQARQYGYDVPQIFAEVYFPQVAQGLAVRVGRILDNPTVNLSHNTFFTHTVFDNNTGDTQTGVVGTLKFSDAWTVQAGAVNTADVAVGTVGSKVSAIASIQWTPNKSDAVYLMAYGINDGTYAYHNWQTYYLIWSHQLSQRLYSRLQLASFYEKDVPVSDVGGQGYIPTVSAAAGATTGYAKGASAIATLQYSITPADYAGVRFEYTEDKQGTLTGTGSTYTTYTLGYSHSFNKVFTGTIDLRYDKSFGNPAFDNTADTSPRMDQALAAASITARF